MAINVQGLIQKSQQDAEAIRQGQPVAVQSRPPVSVPAIKPERKFMQGGIVGKGLDYLNVLESGLAGFAKGGREETLRQEKLYGPGGGTNTLFKSPGRFFQKIAAGVRAVPEAIKNRTYFGDQPGGVDIGGGVASDLGIKNKYVGKSLNLATSLAAPVPPIGGLFKLAGKIPGVTRAAESLAKTGGKAAEAIKTSKTFGPLAEKAGETAYKVGKYFDPLHGVPPKMRTMIKETELKISQRLSGLFKTVKQAATGLTKEEQGKVGQALEGTLDIAGNEKYTKIAEPIRQMADEVGQEAVNIGLLSKEAYEGLKGRYMTHIWEDMVQRGVPGSEDIRKISGRFFKQRTGKGGYIQEFVKPSFVGLGTEIKDVEKAKLYQNIAGTFGVKPNMSLPPKDVMKSPEKLSEWLKSLPEGTGEVPKGFSYLPKHLENTRIGKMLTGTALPKPIADYIAVTANIPAATIFEKAFDKINNSWKFGKTLANPAYHIRNLISNQILSDMATGRGLVRTVADYVGAVINYRGGGNQAFVRAAEDAGLIRKMRFGAALNELVDAAELVDKNPVKKLDNFLGKLQNATEETSKLNVFRAAIEKYADDAGVATEQALADPALVRKAVDAAEEAIFSPYRISPGERALVKWLVPFYAFTKQASVFTGETLVKHPERLIKYPRLKRGIENLSDQVVPEEQRQEYQRGYGVQLPFKNKEGKNLILDTKYLLPFGNFLDGGNGLPLGLNISPFLTEPFQQQANKDTYFNQPIAKSNIPKRAGVERAQHVFRTFAPQIFPTDITGIPTGYSDMPLRTRTGEKLTAAFEGRPDYAGRERSKVMAILDALGIKTSILRPEEQRKFDSLDKRKQIKEIQAERAKITRNKQLRPEEKRLILKELRQVQMDVYRNKKY
ncbi:hypothetical protein HZB78_05575 [Candidatus Collierbacteria bacterium]|nr:hypothetical protein [Candidatus Collierbacteria bacterium]